MTVQGTSRRAFLGLVSASVVPVFGACASGPRLIMGQPIKKEVAVLVRVSKEAVHADKFGGIASIVEVVTEGLTKRGIPNQLYAADDDHPGTPRIEIWVTKWGEGDADLREAGQVTGGIVGAMVQSAGAGEFEVVSKIYREGDAEPVCVHKHSGSVDPDDAGATVGVGDSVGSSILSEALRETADCRRDIPGPNYSVR